MPATSAVRVSFAKAPSSSPSFRFRKQATSSTTSSKSNMSSLSGSLGEGRGSSGTGRAVDFTGYGDGAGNVETGSRDQSGTGFDDHGNVITRFGKYDIGYDPVTGTATRGTTLGYDFPGEGLNAIAGGMQAGTNMDGEGLGDVSASAAGHSTAASWEQSRQGIREATDAGGYIIQPPDRSAREAEGERDRKEHGPHTEGVERPSAQKK